ncbi:hypothetical protein J4Q44_G00337970 [Coregonus suidteri]|uniref:Uncharacterized protein n=1 Tax=Coregonus suidteri TaxID=861788 RepID=A0AAN8KVH6_9TELE
MFGVSKRTIRRRMQQYSLRKTDLYSAVNDEELDRIVSEIHRSHPNTGYKLMRGHLNARGVHVPTKPRLFSRCLELPTVLELKGISHHSNSGEVTESKALRRILLRFLKNMGSIGTDLTAFIEALCQSRGSAGP